MGSNIKKTGKYKSAFHAAEVMSHDLSLLRGKKFSNYFDDFFWVLGIVDTTKYTVGATKGNQAWRPVVD